MIIEHGLIYYIWTDGLKVAELGNNWNNTRKNGMRIKVRSRGELNGKNNLGFDGNHWPGPSHRSPVVLPVIFVTTLEYPYIVLIVITLISTMIERLRAYIRAAAAVVVAVAPVPVPVPVLGNSEAFHNNASRRHLA